MIRKNTRLFGCFFVSLHHYMFGAKLTDVTVADLSFGIM